MREYSLEEIEYLWQTQRCPRCSGIVDLMAVKSDFSKVEKDLLHDSFLDWWEVHCDRCGSRGKFPKGLVT